MRNILDVISTPRTASGVCFLIIEAILVLGFLLFVVSGMCTKVNLGNISGAFICAVLFVCCVKRTALSELIRSAWEKPAGRAAVIAVGSVIGLCIITAAVISVFMIAAMNRLPDKNESDVTVIVLGCRVKDYGPSLMLEKRIAAAYECLSENPEAVCIASGGKGDDEPCSEAEAIRDGLVRRGISPDRIIMEDKSVNTFQNIRNSLRIMDDRGMERRAVIVTSEFHQLRASILAKKQGLEAYSKSSPTFLPLLPAYWIREWFGVIHELIIGRK